MWSQVGCWHDAQGYLFKGQTIMIRVIQFSEITATLNIVFLLTDSCLQQLTIFTEVCPVTCVFSSFLNQCMTVCWLLSDLQFICSVLQTQFSRGLWPPLESQCAVRNSASVFLGTLLMFIYFFPSFFCILRHDKGWIVLQPGKCPRSSQRCRWQVRLHPSTATPPPPHTPLQPPPAPSPTAHTTSATTQTLVHFLHSASQFLHEGDECVFVCVCVFTYVQHV